MDEITSYTFSDEFMIALSNWQNGWYEEQGQRRQIADSLVKACQDLSSEFKKYNAPCYRKRFIIDGEIIPILKDDELFEGIASWTTDENCARNFKGYVKPDTKFAMVFKHIPLEGEVVVNISALWLNEVFLQRAETFKEQFAEHAKAIFNFKDFQSEIVLRSTLKGSEIEDIIGISSSFDDICDMAGIPEEDREERSLEYERNPEGIPISMPVFVGKEGTQNALKKTLEKFAELIHHAEQNNILLNMGNYQVHSDDLKHKI